MKEVCFCFSILFFPKVWKSEVKCGRMESKDQQMLAKETVPFVRYGTYLTAG